MEEGDRVEYYLQVVKEGDKPSWPRPEEELVIKSQSLGEGYVQFWAYEKDQQSKFENQEGNLQVSPVETLAQENQTPKPAILITKGRAEGSDSEGYLELILVKNGHAWGKTESSLENLEDNITAMIDFAKNKFNMKVEYFMTTGDIPNEVERKLDNLEEMEEVKEKLNESAEPGDPEAKTFTPSSPFPELDPWNKVKKVGLRGQGNTLLNSPQPKGGIGVGIANFSNQGSSKFWFLVPIIVIFLIFVGTVFFKDQTFGKLSSLKTLSLGGIFGEAEPTPTPTPAVTPTPTPTPTPTVKREEYKVRVLNGTTKSGAAAALRDQLKEKGWEVTKIGNAKNQATEQTTVSVKEGLKDVLEVMILDLARDFEATSGSVLGDKDTVDVEVVIGRK